MERLLIKEIMTKDEAMQMALDALEAALSDDQPYISRSEEAIKALRTALAQPEPKEYTAFQSPHNCDQWYEHPADCEIIDNFDPPVFVGFQYELTAGRYTTQRYRVTKIADDESDDVEVELVSCLPPQRKPLTNEEMFKLWVSAPAETEDRFAFARAVEAAHGIK